MACNGFNAGNAYFATPFASDYGDGVYYADTGLVKFTNLDHGRRHQPLVLRTAADNLRFCKHAELKGKTFYDSYDNYDAIEVPFTDAIPSDYNGAMGVSISFLDKYCPEQFEIIGTDFNVKDGLLDFIKNNRWNGKFDRGYVNGERQYARILIRHKKGMLGKF